MQKSTPIADSQQPMRLAKQAPELPVWIVAPWRPTIPDNTDGQRANLALGQRVELLSTSKRHKPSHRQQPATADQFNDLAAAASRLPPWRRSHAHPDSRNGNTRNALGQTSPAWPHQTSSSQADRNELSDQLTKSEQSRHSGFVPLSQQHTKLSTINPGLNQLSASQEL